MGGVEVIRPYDFFNNHQRHPGNSVFSKSPMKSQSPSLPTNNSGPTFARSFNRWKRSPPKTTLPPPKVKVTNKTTNHKKNTAEPTTDLVIGKIKILKRGEVLPTSFAEDVKKEEQVVATTIDGLNDLALDPESESDVVVTQSFRISDFYAGSAFFSSPEPSSLPLPVFFRKKDDVLVDHDGSGSDTDTDYDATTDLRRLLRLDLS